MVEEIAYDDYNDSEHSGSVSEEESHSTSKRKLENGANANPSKRSKTKKDKIDINFKESELKFNLFNLQVEGLLTEIDIKEKYFTSFNAWYKKFEKFTKSLQEYEEITVSKIVKKKAKTLKQQFINNLLITHKSNFSTDSDLKLKFVKPEGCVFRITSLIGPQLLITINFIMPKNIFNEKDYLNNRYIIKRQYYLSYIYTELKKSDLFSSVSYECAKEILTVVPNVSDKIIIHIDALPAEDTFKLARFEPDKNNVRENLFKSFDEIDTENLKDHGTPYLNSLILKNLRSNANYTFVENKLKGLKHVKDSLKLLTVWLKNNGLLVETYGFCETLLLNSIYYLVLQNKINNFMNVYQVLRSFWVFLSTTNWHESPISICEHVNVDKLHLFNQNFDVVFLDESGSYNLASFLNLDLYMKTRRLAQLAITLLDDSQVDPFWSLFTTKLDLPLQYDAIIRLDDSLQFKKVYKSIEENDKFKFMGCYRSLIIHHIVQFLRRGLNQRVHHIVPLLNSEDRENERFETLLFGLTLNRNEAFSIIEKGPSGNTAEGAEFKKFWGNLADVRRFADGSICEAVYFPAKTLYERREIFKNIINFVITKKFGIKSCKVISNEFEGTILPKNVISAVPLGTSEEASLKVISVLNDLTKILRGFKLPLEITGVQGISGCFCFTDIFPPLPANYKSGKKFTTKNGDNIVLRTEVNLTTAPTFVEPIECVLQLNLNSKWPNDIIAMRKLKMAFYLEICKAFTSQNIISNIKLDFIEVLYKGLVYRFRLYHPKEISTLKRNVKPDGMVAFKETEESFHLNKTLNILPKMIGSLNGINSQHSSFGPSTCIIKRWLRTQLIDDFHIPDIVIDLLNASLYLHNGPNSDAVLPQVAFLRFLKYFSEFDFNVQCIIVNFNNEITKEQIVEIEGSFQNNRSNYPAIYIVTSCDEQKSIFSKVCSKEIARRFSLLAKTAYKFIQERILNKSFSFQEMYRPNLQGYNVVIKTKRLLNSKRLQHINIASSKPHNLRDYEENKGQTMPVVGFNPVELYLKELRENYGEFALFFHNSYGGGIIGVLWQPKALQEKNFKETFAKAVMVQNNKLVLNKEAIIEDFHLLGKGLVKAIDVMN